MGAMGASLAFSASVSFAYDPKGLVEQPWGSRRKKETQIRARSSFLRSALQRGPRDS
jgi:hypothetical protein